MKILFVAVAFVFGFSAAAQPYSLDWHKVAGGGGSSTGGLFSVAGTIGQHDAGSVMNGAGFSLKGGFWSLLAGQPSAPPLLSIFLTSTNTVVVSWSDPSGALVLEQTSNLPGGNWTQSGEAIGDDGVHKFIIVNPASGNRWYRLAPPQTLLRPDKRRSEANMESRETAQARFQPLLGSPY